MRYFLLSFFLFFLSSLGAQPIDSLIYTLQTTQNDSIRSTTLSRLAFKYRHSNFDTSIILVQEALKIARDKNYLLLEGKALNNLGVIYRIANEYQKAIEIHERGLLFYREKIGDSLLVANILQGLGNTHRHLGNYSKALEYQLNTVKLREEYGAAPSALASTYANVGTAFYFSENYNEAIKWIQKSLDTHEANGDMENMGRSSVNLGGILLDLEKLDESKAVLERGLHIFDSLNLDYGIGACSANLGDIYFRQGDYDEAEAKTQRALEIYRKKGDRARQGMFLYTLGKISFEKKNYLEAIEKYNQSLEFSRVVGRIDDEKNAMMGLANAYEALGEFEKAYNANQGYHLLKDSLFNEASIREINEIQTRYETEKKDQEIERLQSQEEQRIRERNWLLTGLGILLLSLLLAIWAWRSRNIAFHKLKIEQETTQNLLNEKESLLTNLENTQLRLLQADKMASLGQLTAGIAHEINNPINFVTSSVSALKLDFKDLSQLLEKIETLELEKNQDTAIQELIDLCNQIESKELRAEIEDLIGGIERGASRTFEIVKGLRTFSRDTSEEFLKANIHEGLDSTLTILNPQMKDRIRIHKKYAELPEIKCQISRLNQVFLNVLNNSVQAIEKEGDIYIETSSLDQFVQIKIKDNGRGMDEETQKRIFEPFFTTKEVGKGTGLGLSISYGIVEKHKGNIQVSSTIGEGTTFLITLPIHRPDLKDS